MCNKRVGEGRKEMRNEEWKLGKIKGVRTKKD
jgi:hypothetical protein